MKTKSSASVALFAECARDFLGLSLSLLLALWLFVVVVAALIVRCCWHLFVWLASSNTCRDVHYQINWVRDCYCGYGFKVYNNYNLLCSCWLATARSNRKRRPLYGQYIFCRTVTRWISNRFFAYKSHSGDIKAKQLSLAHASHSYMTWHIHLRFNKNRAHFSSYEYLQNGWRHASQLKFVSSSVIFFVVLQQQQQSAGFVHSNKNQL